MKPIRWSDNDKYFGPFTLAMNDHKGFAMMLGSGCSEYPGCRLWFRAFRISILLALPAIIKPYTLRKHGYWETHPQEFGLTIDEGYVSVSYGPQTDDSLTEKRKGWFFPWTSWRLVRQSCFDLKGNVYYTVHGNPKWGTPRHEAMQKWFDLCPEAKFDFLDYDKERITAKCRIEEREWLWGEGNWKWLSIFRKARVCRSMDIRFSSEVGRRKGSWKGGTIGHAIAMRPGELHEDAFRRYCIEQKLEFIG